MTQGVNLIDVIREAFGLWKSWQALSLWAIIAAVLKLIVDASKTKVLGRLFDKFGPVGKILVILTCSALLVGVTVLAAGGSLGEALGAIVQSSAGAMLLHEILSLLHLENDGETVSLDDSRQ